ncbi:LysR substrate-binding domain-containing protein [Acinetobacter sp.]|uniref:LysR family transcriptional regulator n=1 Tax=Acinetobacter sp. TaxID=472 RepID=UPI0031D3BBE7
MHSIPHGFDLNLLLVFDALYRHRSVSKAAEAIYLSPSAFSHALNRLRSVFDDPLFIRMGGKMAATKRAEEIAPIVSESLRNLSHHLFKSHEFDPSISDVELTIATTDYTAFCILPLLMKKLKGLAPNIKLKIVFRNMEASMQNLILGKVDLIVGYSEQEEMNSALIDVSPCFTDRYVVVAPKGLYQDITLDDYVQADHIKISAWNEHDGIIDESLKAQGVYRKISLELPNMMIAPYMMQSADLMITLPSKAVEILKEIHEIDVFSLPIAVPEYRVNIYSVECDKLKSPQAWLKNQILSIF